MNTGLPCAKKLICLAWLLAACLIALLFHSTKVASASMAAETETTNPSVSASRSVVSTTPLTLTLVVNSTDDFEDANPGDGVCEWHTGLGDCSLRAAIQESNVWPGQDTIELPAGYYILSLVGDDEDAGATGDLDITDALVIHGAGSAAVIVDANDRERVFDIWSTGDVTIAGLQMQYGYLYLSNGGGLRHNDGHLTLQDVIVRDNYVFCGTESLGANGGFVGEGGGIASLSGQLELQNVVLQNNTSNCGVAGLFVNSSQVTITASSLLSNTSYYQDGGAIYNAAGHVHLLDSTVQGNQAGNGAGILNAAGGVVVMEASTVSGNLASADGGGIANAGDLQVINSTVSGNTSDGNGGGLFTATGASIDLINVTVVANQADATGEDMGDGGGLFNLGSSLALTNTIIAGNLDSSPLSRQPDCGNDGGVWSVVSHNLIGDNTGCESVLVNGVNGNQVGDSEFPLNPELTALQDNGGPTLTHAPDPGSPVVDTGTMDSCPELDQRGQPRFAGMSCDIGAVEYQDTPQDGPNFVVNTDVDEGDGVCGIVQCTLREAIDAANHSPNESGPDQIAFAIPGPGLHAITPLSELPMVSGPVIINGLTQPGTSCASWPPTLLIQLNGSAAPNANGLTLMSDTTVTGLVINRFSRNGVELHGWNNTLHCNLIGTDASGQEALGNGENGVFIGSDSNLIGGLTPDSRNLIAGNLANGIYFVVGGSPGKQLPGGPAPRKPGELQNLVQGNFIGTNVYGASSLGNQGNGITIEGFYGSVSALIGGPTPGAGNVISGNGEHGIALMHWADYVTVQGNKIGSDVEGHSPVGNVGSGVYFMMNSSNNLIGGTSPGEGNRIAFNGGDGITVLWSYRNTFLGNQIELNGGLGIDLDGNGPTLNDIGDYDNKGANGDQNYPLVLSAVPNGFTTLLSGRLDSSHAETFTLEFFDNSACDPSTYGEGAAPLTTISVTTDLQGSAPFSLTLPTSLPLNHFITATATDSDGNTSEFGPCQAVGPNNVTWPLAYPLPLTAPTAPAAATLQGQIDQYLSRPGQSRWYKIRVMPQSKLTIKLTNLPANYDLTLFKDIAQVYQTLNPPQSLTDLAQLGAEFAPDAFSPDVYSPDVYSPDVYSPDMYSPDVYSPDVYSPDVYSPDVYSPDVYSPDVYSPDVYSPDVYSPDVYSPDVYSPDVYSPDVYSPDAAAYASAQVRSVLAAAGFEGTASEGIIINTWDHSSDFYIRVRGRNGAFSPNRAFHLEVILQTNVCDGVTSTLPPSSLTATAGDFHTLILTDRTRLAVTDPLTPTLDSKLLMLAARPEVRGAIVDVGADARVAAANAQADAFPACPTAKNLVADAIKALVDSYRAVNPLEYIVLIGSDDAIPFFRHPDQALLASERNYVPPVRDSSASQASLRLGYVLSQDDYGAAIELNHKVTTFPVPDLAVGRLVETPAEIIGMVEAYLKTAAGVVDTPTTALVTGYDFLTDNAQAVQAALQTGIGAPADTLIAPANLSPADPAAWTGADLRNSLLGSRHDLVFLAGHFSAGSALAADFSTRLLANEVASSTTNLENTILFSTGCHSGYNVVNAHGITGISPQPDWAQAFARKKVTFIGGTGYQYGDTDFLKYSELIYTEFSQALLHGTGPVPVGKALVAAKQAYLEKTPTLRGIDEKSLLIATLFGLPMLRVDLPYGRSTPALPPSMVDTTSGFAVDPGLTLGLRFADVTITPTLNLQTKILNTNSTTQTVTATYLSGDAGVVVYPAEPVLPLTLRNVKVDGQMLRGIGFRGGHYTDLEDILPLTGAATTEVRGVHIPFSTDSFYPVQSWQANYFDVLARGDAGAPLLLVRPAQFRSSTPASPTGTLRRFDDLDFRLFYSANVNVYPTSQATDPLHRSLGATAPLAPTGNIPALASPPTIVRVISTPYNGAIDYQVTVIGDLAAGIQAVWVTYTAVDGPLFGQWQSFDLTQNAADSTLWEGSLSVPYDDVSNIRAMVQAVNGVGLVSLTTNVGAYLAPGSDPGAPPPTYPISTTVALLAPPSSGPYGVEQPFTAELTSLGAPLPAQPLNFSLGAQVRQGVTDANGRATVHLALLGLPGDTEVRVTFPGTLTQAPASTSAPFTIEKQETSLDLTPSAASGQYSDPINLQAQLRDASGRRLLTKTVFFLADGGALRPSAPWMPHNAPQAKAVITDYSGRARLDDLPVTAGSYTLTAYFMGDIPLGNGQTTALDDVRYHASTGAGTLVMTAEDALVAYTGAVAGAAGQPLNLAAQVTQDDDGSPGDLTLATVRFDLNVADRPTVSYFAAADAHGLASLIITAPAAGTYQVSTQVVGGYFTSPNTAGPTITIHAVPTAIGLAELRTQNGTPVQGLQWAALVLTLLGGGWLWRRRWLIGHRPRKNLEWEPLDAGTD
jgi:CSLREA domain-containing protein